MAFVNERLTPQARADFFSIKIKKPVSDHPACPLYRTIDRERHMCLWHLGRLGRDDFDHHLFLFECSGAAHQIILKYTDPNPDTEEIQWSISKYEAQFCGQEDFAPYLKQALLVYACNGSDKQQGRVLVTVDFQRIE